RHRHSFPTRRSSDLYGLQHARPEVVGIAHLHGFYGRTWSSLGQLFDPITAEAGAFIGDQAIFRRHDLRKTDGTLEQDRDIVTGRSEEHTSELQSREN